jgi:aminoglycoside/choline kinase family phosphotransferase
MQFTREEEILGQHFLEVTGSSPSSISALRPHASQRQMYRLRSDAHSLIGVINPVRKENDAFVSFSRYFRSRGFPVPEIFLYKPESNLYLEEDLGDQTLLDVLTAARSSTNHAFPAAAEELYKRSLEWLPRFQIESAETFDFSNCYPEQQLLPGTFTRDCLSFSNELVSRIAPAFDTHKLNQDFSSLMAFLQKAPASFFVYRDFQSRNIMCLNDKPFFIDFQGGSRGPLQYDVVSLLYQSSAKIPAEYRASLVEHYCKEASKYTSFHAEDFFESYSGFIIGRMIQVLGVYGREGLGAGKEYFTDSIPTALSTLTEELAKPGRTIELPALLGCITTLTDILSKKGVTTHG